MAAQAVCLLLRADPGAHFPCDLRSDEPLCGLLPGIAPLPNKQTTDRMSGRWSVFFHGPFPVHPRPHPYFSRIRSSLPCTGSASRYRSRAVLPRGANPWQTRRAGGREQLPLEGMGPGRYGGGVHHGPIEHHSRQKAKQAQHPLPGTAPRRENRLPAKPPMHPMANICQGVQGPCPKTGWRPAWSPRPPKTPPVPPG